jgi:hypothetical protein
MSGSRGKKVASPQRERTLNLGDGDYSSCPFSVIP